MRATTSACADDQDALRKTVASWLDALLINPVTSEAESDLATPARVVPLRMFNEPETRRIGWIAFPPALTRDQQQMLASVLPSNILALTQEDQSSASLVVVTSTLLMASQARLRLQEICVGPDDLLVGFTASGKRLALLVPKSGTGYVVKSSPLVTSLINELQALKNLPSSYPAPRAVALGRASSGAGMMHTAQTLVPGISLGRLKLDTAGKRQWLLIELGRLLKGLRSLGELTTLAKQADAMRDEISASDIEPVSSKALLNLLEPVVNTQPVTCSRVHGDFRRSNMQVSRVRDASRRGTPKLFLLDWEFSRQRGIGITDFFRFVLEADYDRATTFTELLSESRVSQIARAIKQLGLDGHDLPLAQLLRLHVVMHAFDRIRWFAGGPRTLRLQAILHTPWAGD
jgi:hypothetical protein